MSAPNIHQLSASRGILRGGKIITGTEWVLREEGAWWADGERGTKPRSGHSLIVGHWTAGNAHEGPGTAQRVVRAMKARQRDDGGPMEVGIGFVIGWDGLVYQCADLDTATVHVSAGWNARSVGVECCWPGTAKQAEKLGVSGRAEKRLVAGCNVRALRPSDALLTAWVRLCETLANILDIPRHVPLDRAFHRLDDRMSAQQARSWNGVAEHFMSPSTTKVDAGGYLCDALLAAGWRGVAA